MPGNLDFVVAAYTVTWVFLVAYAVRLHLVSRRARALLEEAARERPGGDS
jgi:hypothetical protein